MRLPERLFVTGTDTDVGKTVVAALLTLGLGATYWKPVQSGAEAETDTQWVRRVTGLPADCFVPEVYCLKAALSPHRAAALEGVQIKIEGLRLPRLKAEERLVVEGAGGVLVPLNDKCTMVDLMVQLGLPVLVVARSGLGTINHTLLTLAALRRRRLQVIGVVMNGKKNKANRDAIEHYGQVPVLAQIESVAPLDACRLRQVFTGSFGDGHDR